MPRTEMKVKALAPWFGSSRIIAPHVGEALRSCRWVCVPFAGGMCELSYIDARTIVVSDLHRHVVNLARVVASSKTLPRKLSAMPFHPDVLKEAQNYCRQIESVPFTSPSEPNEEWAMNYFIAAWMGRSGKSGIDGEFNGGLSRRWKANGGDSAVRYHAAVRSLVEWRRIMQRCTFSVADAFDVIGRCEDQEGHGIYVDPPWPDDGERYKYGFTADDHARLKKALDRFEKTKVVVRYGDHPLIRGLYARWFRKEIAGRTQTNQKKQEFLLLNEAAAPEREDLFPV